jgi:hypothetical protein
VRNRFKVVSLEHRRPSAPMLRGQNCEAGTERQGVRDLLRGQHACERRTCSNEDDVNVAFSGFFALKVREPLVVARVTEGTGCADPPCRLPSSECCHRRRVGRARGQAAPFMPVFGPVSASTKAAELLSTVYEAMWPPANVKTFAALARTSTPVAVTFQ